MPTVTASVSRSKPKPPASQRGRRPRVSHVKRKRGGQPGNSNAFQHGQKRSSASSALPPPLVPEHTVFEPLEASAAAQKWQAHEKRESLIQSHIRSSFVPQKPISLSARDKEKTTPIKRTPKKPAPQKPASQKPAPQKPSAKKPDTAKRDTEKPAPQKPGA